MKLFTPGAALLAVALATLLAIPDSSAQTTHQVDAGDNFFQPASIQITVGDTVQWNFVGVNPHTVTSQTAGLFDSGVQTGGTFSHTFNSAGTFPYICTVHGTLMTGTVVVNQPAPTNTPPPAPTDTPVPQATDTPLPDATAAPTQAPPDGDAPVASGDPAPAPPADEPASPDAAEAGDTIALPATGAGPGAPGTATALPLVLALAGAALLAAAVLRRVR
jgi:plastocyanin